MGSLKPGDRSISSILPFRGNGSVGEISCIDPACPLTDGQGFTTLRLIPGAGRQPAALLQCLLCNSVDNFSRVISTSCGVYLYTEGRDRFCSTPLNPWCNTCKTVHPRFFCKIFSLSFFHQPFDVTKLRLERH